MSEYHKNWDGFLPKGMTCRTCRKELNKNDGRPAELYLGTYTGLCYECERAEPFIEKICALDGAQVTSYPPTCPSYRRNRETYTGYPDCLTCNGAGVASTYYYNWSNHRRDCTACNERFWNHPLRKWSEAKRTAIYQAAEAVWSAELRRIVRPTLAKRAGKKVVAAATHMLAKSPRMEAIRAEIIARYKRARSTLRRLEESRGIWAEQTTTPVAA